MNADKCMNVNVRVTVNKPLVVSYNFSKQLKAKVLRKTPVIVFAM